MKVGDKVLVPVKVAKIDSDGTIKVAYDDRGFESFWAYDTDIQTVTAEDYRNALNNFYEMNSKERSEIWELNLLSDAFQITAEDFVGRLHKYQSEPKTGQIWKASSNQKVVVLKASGNEVHYYRPCGHTSFVSRNYFGDNFLNTGEVLTSIEAFLKDLEGLNEEG